MKKIISLLLSIAMLISMVTVGTISANAAYENTYTNTGNQRADIVGVAKTQLGNTNGSKYGSGSWCAHFVIWCARQAGISSSIIATTGWACADDMKVPYYSRNSYTPKSGDLVFFNWPSTSATWDHVGIVEKVNSDGSVTTIEGNNNGAVRRITYTANGNSEYSRLSSIRGYGVPNYGGGVTHKTNTSYSKNFIAYPKAKITATNIFDANHAQISSTAWIGTSDKCTIHEVYTDGCCKVSYPLDSGGTKTAYSKISLFTLPTLSIKYDANGGAISDTSKYYLNSSGLVYKSSSSAVFVQKMVDGTTYDDGLYNYTTLGISRTGYTFKGWGTTSSGGTIYSQSEAMTAKKLYSSISKGNATITMYAIWEPNTLKVYYNANGSSIDSDTYKLSSNLVYNKSDGSKYYQNWTYNNAKTNGLVNKGTFGLYKTGYTFEGWGTTSSGGTVYSADDTTLKPTTLNSNIKNGSCTTTLYAMWKANTLSVYHNANGASINSDTYKLVNDVIYYKSDDTKFVQNWTYNNKKTNGLTNRGTFGLTKTGHTFKGWGTSASGGTIFDHDDVDLLPATINSNLKTGNCSTTLYAIWEPNKYTIRFDANGGTGVPENQTKIYGTNLILSSTIPTREGYSFLGWSITSDATTANYLAGSSFEINDNTVLYAVWENSDIYGVIYDANGGNGGPTKTEKYYDVDVVISDDIPTKEGSTFLGWTSASDATIPEYVPGDKYSANADIVLYAVWKEVFYGDLDKDNKITANDILCISDIVDGQKIATEYQSLVGDLDGDGYITNADGSLLDEFILRKECSFPVESMFDDLYVDTSTIVDNCYIGDDIDISNVRLIISYTNGVSYLITDGFECSVPNTDLEGIVSINANYEGLSAIHNITVKTPSISVLNSEISLFEDEGCILNAKTDPSNQVVEWISSDTSVVKVVENKLVAVSPGLAEVIARFTYNGNEYSSSIKAQVFEQPVSIENINITTMPHKTNYNVGEELDVDGLEIQVTYSDGTKEIISSGFTVSGLDNETVGEQIISVFYEGFSDTYTVTVMDSNTTPEYVVGDVNGDGDINIMDATEIQRHIAQLTTIPDDRLPCADTDKDGKISILDATQIQRFLAKLIPSL